MTNPMPALSTVAKLYPPDRPAEITRLWSELGAAGERNSERRLMLPRLLTPSERAVLAARREVLRQWLVTGPAGMRRIKAMVGAMMLGFGSKASTEQESDAIYTQYAYALREIPTWAVERACLKFASGGVHAEDLGEKRIDLTWGPSSAQIAVIARAFVEPMFRELRQVGDLMIGVLAPRAESEEDRAKHAEAIAAMTAETAKILATSVDAREAEERRARILKERQQRAEVSRRQEFIDAGVPVPNPMTASLPMMLKLGWRIVAQPGGDRVLVR